MDTGQSKHRLLLVDGDPKSLRVLEVSLKKAGFEVATATQHSEAISALQAALPDLIISDTDLDGKDGFDLCRQIKAKPEWAKIPFLFVSGRKSIEDKIRGLELGVDDYLTKPIYIKEIGIRVRTALQRAERERLESRREGRTKFAGDLSDIGVVDLVQTIELNRKSGIIHIVNRDGRRGAVFFREGRVIDAEVGRLSGAEAMYRLFSWSEGRFEVEFKPIRRRDVIDLPSAALLMEGMRRLDEWTRLLEKLPALDSVIEVDFRVLGEQLADLPDEMNGLLRLCDGTRSLLAVIDDSDFPDLEALTMVNRLFEHGIIFTRELPGRRQAEPGGELARWLAEGSAEEKPSADASSLGQQSPTESQAGGPSPIERQGLRSTADDGLETAERQAAKTLRAFSLDSAGQSIAAAAPAKSAADGSSVTSKPDTLRGIPIPESILEPDQAGLARQEPDGDPGRSARTTVEFASRAGDSVPVTKAGPEAAPASEFSGEQARETDWGGWAQGTDSKPAAESEPLQATAPSAQVRPEEAEIPAAPSSEAPPIATDAHVEIAHDSDRALQTQSDEDAPAMAQGSSVSDPLTKTMVMRPWTARGRLDGDLLPHERRWPFYAVGIILLIVAGIFAVRIGSTRNGSTESSSPDSPPVTAPTAKAPSAIASSQAAANRGDAQTVGDAGQPDVRVKPTAFEQEQGNKPKVASGETASRAAADGQAGAPTAAPAAQGPGERCRKVDAGGKGRPAAVLAACRPAIEAEPTAADIMVILARVELDRGRAADARSWAKKAIEINPNLADAYVFLGGAEQEVGTPDAAKTAYKKYLELAPNGRHARELRAVLNSM